MACCCAVVIAGAAGVVGAAGVAGAEVAGAAGADVAAGVPAASGSAVPAARQSAETRCASCWAALTSAAPAADTQRLKSVPNCVPRICAVMVLLSGSWYSGTWEGPFSQAASSWQAVAVETAAVEGVAEGAATGLILLPP